jgi:hypothetical protein
MGCGVCAAGVDRVLSFPKATGGLEPISYRGVLLSTLLHAIVYVLVQIANKMGLKNSYYNIQHFRTQSTMFTFSSCYKSLLHNHSVHIIS